jgi:hypothetical protein
MKNYLNLLSSFWGDLHFSFGKPAAIVNVSIGKKGVYFEPELRWGLNGKPWSYIYWLRYKYQKSDKFGFRTGVHPSYVFKETSVVINGKEVKRYVSQRYVAGEIAPTFTLSPKFSLGLHYLYSKGLDNYAIQNGHFISVQPHFPQINAGKGYYFGFHPQVFHLILDDKKGTYVSESLSFNKKDLPVSLTSAFTYKIKSTIAGDNVVWNVGLNFHFD